MEQAEQVVVILLLVAEALAELRRIGVFARSGATALTRMFALDHSSASACIRLTIAAFVALYTA